MQDLTVNKDCLRKSGRGVVKKILSFKFYLVLDQEIRIHDLRGYKKQDFPRLFHPPEASLFFSDLCPGQIVTVSPQVLQFKKEAAPWLLVVVSPRTGLGDPCLSRDPHGQQSHTLPPPQVIESWGPLQGEWKGSPSGPLDSQIQTHTWLARSPPIPGRKTSSSPGLC